MTTAWPRQDESLLGHRYAASKVPVITAYFWIIKVLTTAMGEATSDYFAHHYDPYLVVPLGGIALVITLIIQLAVDRYITWIYWLTVVMVAIVGTMFADALHIQFKIPYYQTSAFFAVALTVIFVLWYRSERTLSIHSILTRRREMFYWATVLATFALGTALGDLTARTLHEGFLGAGFMFAVVIAIPAIAHWKFGMNAIFAFWFAYVVTRPLGASFADYMDMPKWIGGLALGEGPVAIGLTIPIVILVAYLGLSRKDVEEEGPPAAAPAPGGRHRQAATLAAEPAWAPAADQVQQYPGHIGLYSGEPPLYRDQDPRYREQAPQYGQARQYGDQRQYTDQPSRYGDQAPGYPDQRPLYRDEASRRSDPTQPYPGQQQYSGQTRPYPDQQQYSGQTQPQPNQQRYPDQAPPHPDGDPRYPDQPQRYAERRPDRPDW
jgi:uncharacterized membrane-anchored protein